MEIENIKIALENKSRILGESDYEVFSVLLLLKKIDGKLNIVFEKRAENIKQGGEICFPGGKLDLSDADCSITALRETYEEIGIPNEEINILGQLPPFIAPMGFLIETFVGYTDFEIENANINKDEVEKVFFIPLEYFLNTNPDIYDIVIEIKPYVEKNGEKIVLFPTKDLNLPERYHDKWGGIKNKVYVYHTKYGTLWGITAKLVYEFIKIIKKVKKNV